ncbi:MAG: hypothetical protein ACKOWF_14815 [Chloroflexota bacterium]
MRLLMHDTIATLPWTVPLAEGWMAPPEGIAAERRPTLAAAEVEPGDSALLPAPEAARLIASHVIVPTAAAVFANDGPVALRTPVRPDEVHRTPVRLIDCSSAGELLARGLLRNFYGIETAGFTRDERAAAEAVVVEGAEALRPVEAGFSEDLARAWQIFTDLPFVSHVLVMPAGTELAAAAPLTGWLNDLAAAAETRRREWRQPFCDRETIPRDRLDAMLGGMRHALAPDDGKALTALLSHGGKGTEYPIRPAWRFIGG